MAPTFAMVSPARCAPRYVRSVALAPLRARTALPVGRRPAAPRRASLAAPRAVLDVDETTFEAEVLKVKKKEFAGGCFCRLPGVGGGGGGCVGGAVALIPCPPGLIAHRVHDICVLLIRGDARRAVWWGLLAHPISTLPTKRKKRGRGKCRSPPRPLCPFSFPR